MVQQTIKWHINYKKCSAPEIVFNIKLPCWKSLQWKLFHTNECEWCDHNTLRNYEQQKYGVNETNPKSELCMCV